MELELQSSGPDQTRAIGAALGRALLRLGAQPDAAASYVLLLRGDYGTGKTTLVQGIAAALGIRGAVRSPSYLIVKVYDEGALRLVHADLYRSRSGADIAELGLDELLEGGADARHVGALLAVEWPGEKLPLAEALPTLQLSIHSAEGPGLPASSAGLQSGIQIDEPGQRTVILEWSPDCIGLISALIEELAHAPAAR